MTEPTYTREDMARILNNAGWTCSGGAHEPGNYDICDDCQETCLDVADVVIRALPEMLAHAWDEGRESGTIATLLKLRYGVVHQTWNPYEQGEA